MRPYQSLLLFTFCLFLLTGCASGTGTGIVSGAIKYRETPPPAGGTFEVELYDFTHVVNQTGNPVFMSRAFIPNTGKPEIPFAIAYDKADLILKNTYIVQAALRDEEGKLLYSSGPWHLVITQGNPSTNIELWVASQVRPEPEP